MSQLQQLYVAVTPPADVIDTIDNLPTKAQRGVRFTKRDRWHVTLKFLGDIEPDDAAAVLWELKAAAVDVALGPKVSLLGSRILMIPAKGLDELAATTAAAFDDVAEPQPDRDFTGHLTLARLKGAPLRDPSSISVFEHPIEAGFRATSLALYGTELTPEGSVRTLIAEIALGE